MISQLQTRSPKILAFNLSGKLHDQDYKTFVPVVDAAIAAHGKIRMFARFEDFQGWDVRAAWDDFVFGVQHYADADRIAMVGDRTWEAWMAKLCRPFTKASVKYFDASESEAAWQWLAEGLAET